VFELVGCLVVFPPVVCCAACPVHTDTKISKRLELDKEDSGFLLPTDEETAAVTIFIYLFSSALIILLNSPSISCPSFSRLLRLTFA
jgi:hypothetical protein